MKSEFDIFAFAVAWTILALLLFSLLGGCSFDGHSDPPNLNDPVAMTKWRGEQDQPNPVAQFWGKVAEGSFGGKR